MPTSVELVNEIFDRFAAGDAEFCRSVMHPDYVYESKLTPALGLESVSDPDATIKIFFEYLPATFEEFEMDHSDLIEIEPGQVLTKATYRGRGRHSGATVERELWKIFTLEGQQVRSMIEYDSRADAVAAARAAAATSSPTATTV